MYVGLGHLAVLDHRIDTGDAREQGAELAPGPQREPCRLRTLAQRKKKLKLD